MVLVSIPHTRGCMNTVSNEFWNMLLNMSSILSRNYVAGKRWFLNTTYRVMQCSRYKSSATSQHTTCLEKVKHNVPTRWLLKLCMALTQYVKTYYVIDTKRVYIHRSGFMYVETLNWDVENMKTTIYSLIYYMKLVA